MVPGANLGGRYAVFEAVHGSAPDIAGQGAGEPDRGGPQSAAMMLDHVGQRDGGRADRAGGAEDAAERASA